MRVASRAGRPGARLPMALAAASISIPTTTALRAPVREITTPMPAPISPPTMGKADRTHAAASRPRPSSARISGKPMGALPVWKAAATPMARTSQTCRQSVRCGAICITGGLSTLRSSPRYPPSTACAILSLEPPHSRPEVRSPKAPPGAIPSNRELLQPDRSCNAPSLRGKAPLDVPIADSGDRPC